MSEAAETLQLVRRIRAPVERVFGAWTDLAALRQFMCPGSGTVGEIAADIREGGAFRIVMRVDGRPIEHRGRYVKIEKPRLLAFTWSSPAAGEDTLVTLNFAPEGGATVLTLTHERLPSAHARGLHEHGWASILDKVGALVGAKNPL